MHWTFLALNSLVLLTPLRSYNSSLENCCFVNEDDVDDADNDNDDGKNELVIIITEASFRSAD